MRYPIPFTLRRSIPLLRRGHIAVAAAQWPC